MVTGMQTEEYLSVNDLPHLLNEICPISPHHVLSFGLQLNIQYTEIQEFEMYYNNKAAILGRILYKALNRHPPLTKGEIVKALRTPSVQEDRLANQIETNYIPLSQRGPQHVGAESLPVAQTGHSYQIPLQSAHQQPPALPHATLENVTQLLSNIQSHPRPILSQSFVSQQLNTEVPRLDQPQPNVDQVGQSHQLQASHRMSMPPQPGPQMQLWPQLQFPPHHPNYQHLPLSIHPGYPFSLLPNPPIHRPHCPTTYSDAPPSRRLRQQYPSLLLHSSPASEATASTATYPPLVNDFISFVMKTYSAQKVLRDEKWSLSPTVKFINLACIDRKCVKGREYNNERVKRVKSTEFENVTREMVRDGNVDAIEEKKGPIEFSEIAKSISLPSSCSEQENDRRLILVEGAPGVGKSTFAWEFCRKWMNGKIAQQYHLVLLLRLRDERIRSAHFLEDLFFHPSKGGSSVVCEELITSHTFHALIILEGYDELPDSCRNDSSSVFNELISGKLLPLATVLVTSRPWATKDLHVKYAGHIYQHIEVLGFTKKQIKEYINESIHEQRVRSDFDSYLKKHPQIRSGMYIPLNSAIVVAVYKDCIQNDLQTLPNTITELYSCYIIKILIGRHLKRNTGLQGGNEMNLPAINLSVPSDVHRNFVHMCHLAFSGIVEATEVKVIFSESELPEHFDNLGFMDSVTDLYVTGETVSSHNFLHLTFQEFFAAVHISTMSKEQQLQYFRQGNCDSGTKGGRLNVILKFLAGLQKLDCVSKQTANVIVDYTFSGIKLGTNVVNWLFEAQSETAMSLILREGEVKFVASKRHMSPMDYYSLGYCISHSQCQWVLQLESKMELTKERIKLLADGARDVNGEGKVVELEDKVLSHLKGDKIDMLFTEWNKFLCLRKVSVNDCGISNEGAKSLANVLHHNSTIHTLNMWGNEIGDEGAIALADALHHNCTLKLLNLSSNSIGNKGVSALADALHHTSTLQSLYLSNNRITGKGAVGLAEALQHNCTLQSLDLSRNRITDEGAVALAGALLKSQSLQRLDLDGNSGIGDRATGKIVEALTQNPSINRVYLPKKYEKYATKCPNYHQVQTALSFC